MRTLPLCTALVLAALIIPLEALSQWVQTGAPIGYVQALRSWGLDLFAGTFAGVYRSTDSGNTWIALNEGLPDMPVIDLVITRKGMFAATSTSGLYRSKEVGAPWQSTNFPYQYINVLGADDTTVFVGTSLGGMYRSTDNGNSWDTLGLTNINLRSIAFKDSTVFVGADWAGINRSTDAGLHWTAVNSGLRVRWVDAMMAYGDSMLASDDGIFVTGNDGDSWIYQALSQNTIVSFAVDGNKLFAGAWGGDNLFLSTDNGSTWKLENNGFPIYICWSLLVKDGYLYAGTDAGVWRKPVSDFTTGASDPPSSIPKVSGLEQNYPNPFNPSTRIKYTVGTRGQGSGISEAGGEGRGSGVSVRLAVYDLLGKEVAVLVNERKAPGYYGVNFDGSGLASGIYLYRFEAGDFVQAKRMALIK